MIEAVSAYPTQEELIKEVFIDPIRTVVVIDDDFPTIDALVTNELGGDPKSAWKKVDLERVKKILDFARGKERPWLVDVHDAKRIRIESETRIAPYLDHSDLLVLDYHLQGSSGSGEASIKILRQLAQNGHHNLVILYTGGYSGDYSTVLREIAIGLTCWDQSLGSDQALMKATSDLVDDWEGSEIGITKRLMDQVSSAIYLRHRHDLPASYKRLLATDEGKALQALFSTKPADVALGIGNLVEWLFWRRQSEFEKAFCGVDLGPIRVDSADGVGWLRSERLFVTLVPKSDEPNEFENRLTAALVHSYPGPHRLLLAKMRAAIDEQGSHAEVAILGDKAVQTAWLDDFLNPAPADESTAIFGTINRHWEALGDQMRGTLQPFSKGLRDAFLGLDRTTVFNRSGLDQADLKSSASVMSYNRFVSTKTFDRSHLTTGHIFKIISSAPAPAVSAATVSADEPVTTSSSAQVAVAADLIHEAEKLRASETPPLPSPVGQFWICLSPACDMVPGQKTKGWNGRLGTSIPFVAARLFEVKDSKAAEAATTNNFVFFEVEGKTKAFSIYPDQGDISKLPEWEQMFVTRHGRFEEGAKIVLSLTTMSDGLLVSNHADAEVLAQLRAEYALNLLHRMGSFLFRPGLGMHFKSMPTRG